VSETSGEVERDTLNFSEACLTVIAFEKAVNEANLVSVQLVEKSAVSAVKRHAGHWIGLNTIID
jgi:hypothetical protein